MSTKHAETRIELGRFGILTIPGDITPEYARRLAHQFLEARRTNSVVVMDRDATFTPLKPARKRIRLAQAERGHA